MPRRPTDGGFQILGWGLFLACAVCYIAANIRSGDWLSLTGSVLFLVACGAFLIPLMGKTEQSEERMETKAFQDYYPDHLSHCYGCGRLNEYGLQINSYWDGDETVCRLTPKPYHLAIPGFVYGGLIASVIDCHGTGTAAAAAYRAEGRAMDTDPPFRFVTAALRVDFLKPTPMGVPLEVRATVVERKAKKAVVRATVSAAGEVCARGEVVAVRMPESMAGAS